MKAPLLLFLGDLHQGLTLPHSTRASARAYNAFKQDLAQNVSHKTDTEDRIISLGDVFHNFQVGGESFYHGYRFCRQCDYVLGGNHDYSNDTTLTSSLERVSDLFRMTGEKTNVVFPFFAGEEDAGVTSLSHHDTFLVMVPYVPTQEGFEAVLEKVKKPLKPHNTKYSILALHCNYDNPFCNAEIENNLTEKMAKKLLEHYDFIISGHEHNSRTLFDGRLIMTGALAPMRFDEMTPKYVWEFDVESGKFSSTCIWDPSLSHVRLDYGVLLNTSESFEGTQFVEITGELDPQDLLALTRKIVELRKLPGMLAVKNSAKLPSREAVLSTDAMTDWTSTILRELDTDEVELFKELLNETK